jgi:hypothetical protein
MLKFIVSDITAKFCTRSDDDSIPVKVDRVWRKSKRGDENISGAFRDF